MGTEKAGVWGMNVLLYADGKYRSERCTWVPDEAMSVFPLLLATKDGHYYRLDPSSIPEDGSRPQDELTYLLDTLNPKNPRRLIDQVVIALGERLEPGVQGQLMGLLERFQEEINGFEREAGEASVKIQQLEAELKALKG